jgi:hypothetical protein
MRRPEPLDPAVERDLAALDAAVAEAPDADPELLALIRDVRALAPRPAASARAALDARVAAGFPRAPRPDRRPRWLPRPALMPALGAAAAAFVALVVVVGVARNGHDAASGGSAQSARPRPERSTGTAVPPAATVAPAAPGAAAPSAPAPGLAAPASPARRVERSVRLELGARGSRFDAVTDAVVRTTQRAGGFVAGSQIGQDATRGSAMFVLRIPAARLDATVADLSRLAHVRSIEQATQDLTGAHDGTAARLRDARTRRRALVAALATATGERADRLRGRLAAATAQVRRLERALRALRNRTAYATVDVTVTAPRRAATAPARHDRWTPADAWRDARRGLELAAGVAIVAIALGLPVALVGALAALGVGSLRRRRRDAALDLV